MKWLLENSTLTGEVSVPADKSIAHRAVMLASLAMGRSRLSSLPAGNDVGATITCCRNLGVTLGHENGTVVIDSNSGLRASATSLDAANSGTTMRLLTGVLAGQPFPSRLIGDASLSRRPMRRVVEPLELMGARIETFGGVAPLSIQGSRLHGISYSMPVASAQVKSSIMLAALSAEGTTTIHESLPTRDHTERMLTASAVRLTYEPGHVAILGGQLPEPLDMRIPGDFSSAAFFLVGAVLTGGRVTIAGVGVNPTRTGLLSALRHMGATVAIENVRHESGEPVGDVSVSGAACEPICLGPKDVPALIDELPLIALLATQARGQTRITGAAELRVKETDRIAAVATELRALGADILELPDGFVIDGPTELRGAQVDSHRDHRLAMMLAVAGCVATGRTLVNHAEAATISFPEFVSVLSRLSGRAHAG